MIHFDDHTDLATMIRDDVAASEPGRGLDASVPARMGRRRLRTRRLVSGLAGAVVVTVGAAIAVPLVTEDHPDQSTDVTEGSGAHHAAPALHEVLAKVSGTLQRSVPDLGPATVGGADGDGQLLPADRYDRAVGFSLIYRHRGHVWGVALDRTGKPDQSFQDDCRSGLEESSYLACDVTTTPDGQLVQTRLVALVRTGGRGGGWATATPEQLATGSGLYFQRSATAAPAATVVTVVWEQLPAASRADAEAAFRTPLSDLVDLASDPVLVAAH